MALFMALNVLIYLTLYFIYLQFHPSFLFHLSNSEFLGVKLEPVPTTIGQEAEYTRLGKLSGCPEFMFCSFITKKRCFPQTDFKMQVNEQLLAPDLYGPYFSLSAVTVLNHSTAVGQTLLNCLIRLFKKACFPLITVHIHRTPQKESKPVGSTENCV